jgi:hypothetical protein
MGLVTFNAETVIRITDLEEEQWRGAVLLAARR